MSEQLRNSKEEKDEKDRRDSWDEKWRRDPVDAAAWALILIWAGLVLIAMNMGILDSVRILGYYVEAWPVGFMGAGVIVLLGVFVRLLVPAYRRPVMGSLIFGVILLGIGFGEVTGRYEVIGALILIAIGTGVLLRGFFRGS
jgi:uncharacterized membrane protein